MEEIIKESVLRKYKNIDELEEVDKRLLLLAREASENAYAPYSRFNVGAALILQNGEIELGSNQENIAYPSGLCAERVAIFHSGAKHPDVPVIAMAITARAKDYKVDFPVMPCGSCLQAISEYERRFENPIRLILQGQGGDIFVANGVSTFLPFQFWVDGLKKKS